MAQQLAASMVLQDVDIGARQALAVDPALLLLGGALLLAIDDGNNNATEPAATVQETAPGHSGSRGRGG